MKSIRNAAIVCTGLALMLIGDAPPQAPLPFQMVSEASAVFGVWRRHARRWAVVGTAAVASSAASASAAEHSQESATAQQQAATAQQQSATAAQQSATAQQQAETAERQAAPGSAAPPPPAAAGKALPLGTVVSTLPHGCTSTPVGGVEYYYCGGNFYRAMFQGNSLVYVTAQPK
jgi:hypothetical protein